MHSKVPHEPVLLSRRKMLLGAVFAASAGVSIARQPRTRIDYLGAAKLEGLIPKQIGKWNFATTSGLVIPADDALSDALYSQLLTRVYADGVNPPVMLLIAQSAGQTGFLQIHRPEACYPAGGYALSAPLPVAVATPGKLIRAVQLTASGQGREEHILYWTRIGDAMPASWAQQRLAVARDNLKGLVPDAVLVRVSTVDPDQVMAAKRLTEFVEAMVGGLSAPGRRVLVA